MLNWKPIALLIGLALMVPNAESRDLTLNIRHLWNGAPVTLPSDPLTTGPGEVISLTRLAYLLSEPCLKQQDDPRQASRWIAKNDWQAFVDATSPANNTTLKDLPEGRYTAIRFNIGLAEEPNHSDPSQYGPDHPLNPILNKLHWTWQGGYIFLAMEGHLLASLEGRRDGFSYHIGNDPNLMEVILPIDFELKEDTTLVIDFHLDQLFSGSPAFLIVAQTSSHGRPGDPLATLLKKRIENAMTVASVIKTAIAPGHQPASSPGNLVGTPYRFTIPKGFPIPKLPTDFPLTTERVALGKTLFSDPLLSRSNTLSCASCHQADKAFSDSRPLSVGEEGRLGRRQAMPLLNLAWKSTFFWDGRAPSLRQQALVPIQDHNEFAESLDHVISELIESPGYPAMFGAAFGEETITAERIGVAIEQFVLTLTSLDSKFDRAVRGAATLTAEEKRGLELFFTEYDPRRGLYGADCFHCHGGPFFSDFGFHNNGLPAQGDDRGLAEFSGRESDSRKFSTPSLRNVEVSAPYMHDGRLASLEAVITHYDSGIADSDTLDPNLEKHPSEGLRLSDADKKALVAFLRTLTDPKIKPTDSGN